MNSAAIDPQFTPLLIIGRAEVRELLTIDACFAQVRDAMIAISRGETVQPIRRVMPVPGRQGVVCSMQGSLGAGRVFGTKVISVMHDVPAGTPSHQGILVLHDERTGAPMAVIEAGEVTSLRTAAASALATDALALPDAATLALLGYGVQARAHVHAIAAVRKLEQIVVWGPRRDQAEQFAGDAASATGVNARATGNAQEAVSGASIICAVTSAREPVLHGEWLAPGTHVNLVGSSTASTCEADADVVIRARYFVDERSAAMEQAAEFVRARARGLVDDDWIVGEIGSVLDGRIPGRRQDTDITVYKSLGTIAQDLSAGIHLYEQARAKGIGTQVEL
jgi:ornithine cyclodeaminase